MGCGQSTKKTPAAAPVGTPPPATVLEPAAGEAKDGSPQAAAGGPVADGTAAKDAAPASADAAGGSVKVEVLEAKGLTCTGKLTCSVEVSSKPHTKQVTPEGKTVADPEWNHATTVCGYAAGDGLTFTVLEGTKTVATASLDAEQVRAGFVGEVPLKAPISGEVLGALKVNVDGTDATVVEQLEHVVGEVQVAVAEAVSDALQATGELGEKAADIVADVRQVAVSVVAGGDKEVEVDDKPVFCSC